MPSSGSSARSRRSGSRPFCRACPSAGSARVDPSRPSSGTRRYSGRPNPPPHGRHTLLCRRVRSSPGASRCARAGDRRSTFRHPSTSAAGPKHRSFRLLLQATSMQSRGEVFAHRNPQSERGTRASTRSFMAGHFAPSRRRRGMPRVRAVGTTRLRSSAGAGASVMPSVSRCSSREGRFRPGFLETSPSGASSAGLRLRACAPSVHASALACAIEQTAACTADNRAIRAAIHAPLAPSAAPPATTCDASIPTRTPHRAFARVYPRLNRRSRFS